MKYKHGTRQKAVEYEKQLVKYWKTNNIFEKSVDMRPKDNAYVFYDGPPFITGIPHHGTLLSSVVKDTIPRYWTMKGKRVERVWGWDCHGLPAEVYTEKKLGIKDKRDIGTKISLEDYINACRANMVQTGNEWEDTIDRIGRWVNFKGAYKTMDKNYMESVWWAFKKLFDDGKIYEGEKVLLYCTRDATPLSKAEVAMDNSYQDITDPSVYVKFKLKDRNAFLLAWTTTPWTLNANTAIAINKDVEYAQVEVDSQQLILAKELVQKVMTDEKHQPLSYKIVKTFKGQELVGLEYDPLFKNRGTNAHKIWHADFVTAEEGTGIAHEAPAYGEDDYILAKAHGIPLVIDTDEEGYYKDGDWKGKQVWEVNKEMAKSLHSQGIIWKIVYVTHSYPHCHRCGTKLMYRAHPSWFMDIEGQRKEMLEQNANINWFPEHIKHGRFEKTVETAPDWNLSRDRFWATALPVWKGKDKDGKEHIKVIGSYAELKELSGIELNDYHRPWIDDVTFKIGGVEYKRVDKVMDSWFEAASMPFAQFHYPFENVEKFEENFPGDFIAEYVGQVRAWFYYLHAVSVGISGKNSYKNVIVTGTIAGNDGRKMSKSYGNYTDPNQLMDLYSADALRFLYLSSPVLNGEDFSLQDKDLADINRKLSMVWNMFDFFTMYAEVDGWEWDGILKSPVSQNSNILDQWIVSRMHQTSKGVDAHMMKYDIPNALKLILPLIDDASNWYVRRSRRRFWKSEDDRDKNEAYQTLHYILVRLSQVLAPFTPFLADELFIKLTGEHIAESVHLTDWPEVGHINELLIDQMATVRSIISLGLSQRAAAGIKIRQPLAAANIKINDTSLSSIKDSFYDIIIEELNVKKIEFVTSNNIQKNLDNNDGQHNVLYDVKLDLKISTDLKLEGIAREIIRQVQIARKQFGLDVDNQILLEIESSDQNITEAITKYAKLIAQETLAKKIQKISKNSNSQLIKIDNIEAQIAISKA